MLYYRVEVHDKDDDKWYGLFSLYLLEDDMINIIVSEAKRHFDNKLNNVNPRRFFKNHNRACHSYFTNHGISEFKDSIRFLMDAYSKAKVETRLIVVDKNQYPATYIDDYQVVLADGEEINS